MNKQSGPDVKPGNDTFLPAAKAPEGNNLTDRRKNRYAQRVFDGEIAELAKTTSGRNNRATAAARKLGNLVGGGWLLERTCEDALIEACKANGAYGDNQKKTLDTIRSNLKDGMTRPNNLDRIGTARGQTGRRGKGSPASEAEQPAESEFEQRRKARQKKEALARGQKWWKDARNLPGTQGAAYLEKTRGVPLPASDEARFHPAIYGKDTGKLPALLFPIKTLPDSADPIGYLRIFLDNDKPKKASLQGNAKQILAQQEGGGIWFGDPTCECLVVTEGVENALSALAAGYRFVVAAVSAGNLPKLSIPDHVSEVIIAADRGGDGEKFAKRAADGFRTMERKVLFALPPEEKGPGGKFKDWNDTLVEKGQGAVREALDQAAEWKQETAPEEEDKDWPALLPYAGGMNREAYPVEALPALMREAVEEVTAFVKAPVEMAATCSLTALSLAGQGLADVQRDEGLTGSIGIFTCCMADSGERKTTLDKFFTRAVRAYETEQRELAEPELAEFRASYTRWKAEKEGYETAIRQLAKDGKDTSETGKKLYDHELDEPKEPRVPSLLRGEDTTEKLAYDLAKQWPSQGVIQSEAGVIFGSHAMGSDKVMSALAVLNTLWDGAPHKVGRRTSESFVVENAKLTVGLQIQEATLRSFCQNKGELARGIGFFARFLFARPSSTQGTRNYTKAPAGWPKLSKLERRLIQLLEMTPKVDERGRLNVVLLTLDEEAQAEWINIYNAIEGELVEGGEYYDVRDVASKSSDNIVRLAALFHLLEHGPVGEIDIRTLKAAAAIALWHLGEAKRFFCDFALPVEVVAARQLEEWLVDYSKKERPERLSQRVVQQLVVPKHLRKREALDEALVALTDLGRARLVSQGKQRNIEVRPSLLRGAAHE